MDSGDLHLWWNAVEVWIVFYTLLLPYKNKESIWERSMDVPTPSERDNLLIFDAALHLLKQQKSPIRNILLRLDS